MASPSLKLDSFPARDCYTQFGANASNEINPPNDLRTPPRGLFKRVPGDILARYTLILG